MKEKDVSFTILIPTDRYESLKETAKMKGMALAAFIRDAAYAAEKEFWKN